MNNYLLSSLITTGQMFESRQKGALLTYDQDFRLVRVELDKFVVNRLANQDYDDHFGKGRQHNWYEILSWGHRYFLSEKNIVDLCHMVE